MEKTYTKEEKKEHVRLYKKSILFYSPYLIVLGLFITELSPLIYKNNQLFISPIYFAILLILPIVLIILEYVDQTAGFFMAALLGFFFYFYMDFFSFTLTYISKTHNFLSSLGLILIVLGFISCIVLYKTVMRKVLSKNKIETTIDTMQEQNNFKDGAYIIGNYFCGFKDVKSHLPCLIYSDEKELKFVFLNDTEKIQKSLDKKLINSLTYRSSNRAIPSDSSYLKLNLAKFVMFEVVGNMPLTWSSPVINDAVSNTKVEVKVCWEIELKYMDNDKEMLFLMDVYSNPKDFVSNFNLNK